MSEFLKICSVLGILVTTVYAFAVLFSQGTTWPLIVWLVMQILYLCVED